MSDHEAVLDCARRARVASRTLRTLTRNSKDRALEALADALEANAERIVAANSEDVDRATENDTSPAIIDRLTLTPARISAIADALREVAALPDPVGEVVRGYTLPNGLQIRQVHPT